MIMEKNDFVKKVGFLVNNSEKIDWRQYFMSLSLLASCRSSCNRLHVGCVLVKDNRIISMGYNGFIQGAPHKSVVRNNHEISTVHAEQNAISYSAKFGVCIDKCDAYITHYPCINCAKILAASGIKKIYYHNDYKNDEEVRSLLNSVQIEIEQI